MRVIFTIFYINIPQKTVADIHKSSIIVLITNEERNLKMITATDSSQVKKICIDLEQRGLEELIEKLTAALQQPRSRINMARERFLNNERRSIYVFDFDTNELKRVEPDFDISDHWSLKGKT